MPQNQLTSFPAVVPYADITFADAYFSTTISRRRFWKTLPDNDPAQDIDKQGALCEATLVIDALYYSGHKLQISQEREWPRFLGFGTYGDIFYLEQKIPVAVAQATCEQAYYIAHTLATGGDIDARLDHQAQGIGSISRAGAQETADLNFARRHSITPRAYDLLRPFISKTGNLDRFYRIPRA